MNFGNAFLLLTFLFSVLSFDEQSCVFFLSILPFSLLAVSVLADSAESRRRVVQRSDSGLLEQLLQSPVRGSLMYDGAIPALTVTGR